MALAEDFKQSEVGAIPVDWNLIEVDQLSTSVASGRSKQDSQYGDFPLYGSTGIIGTVTKGEYSGEAILVARVGANAGQLNIVSGIYGVTDNTIIVKINSNIPLEYVWRQLEAKKLNRMVFGSGQPLITGTQIKAIKIPVPATRGEQEAIANALSDVDALIESLEKLVAKKRLIKKGTMQELLTGRRRLPEFGEAAKLRKTELGAIPDDWVIKLLPDVCKFRSGKAHEQFIVEGGQYVCVNSKFISTDGKVRKYSSANFCPARTNDILMVMSDLPNGRALAKVFIADKDDFYAVNQRVCALTPYKDDPKFLGLQLNRNPYFLKFDDGVSQTHLLNKIFEKCPVFLPTRVEEQKAISEIISNMSTEIDALENKLEKARLIKQGMMQQLLTGRIRLI